MQFRRSLAVLVLQLPALFAQFEVNVPAERFCRAGRISGYAISDDGLTVAWASDLGGAPAVWMTGSEGGEARKIGGPAGLDSLLAILPREPRRFVVSTDEGVAGDAHVLVLDENGKAHDLTPGSGVRASWLGMAGNEVTLFLATNERKPEVFDLYAFRDRIGAGENGGEEPYPRELVFQNDEGFGIEGISPDGKLVALSRTRSFLDSDLYVAEIGQAGKRPRLLTQHKGDQVHRFAGFSLDSGTVYFLSDREADFLALYSHELQGGRERLVEQDACDVTGVSFARSGRFRLVRHDDRGRTRLAIKDLSRSQDLEIPEAGDAAPIDLMFSGFGSKALVATGGDQSPLELFTWDMATEATTQVTKSMPDDLDPGALVGSIPTRLESTDQTDVPALLYKPQQARRDRRVPVVIVLGDGPRGQKRSGYDPAIQALANHGIGSLVVNPRGSTGFGKKFAAADDRKHGEADLKDCLAAKTYLEGLPWVEPAQIAIAGEGYGGYLAILAAAKVPGAFKAVYARNPILDLGDFAAAIPPSWENVRNAWKVELGDADAQASRWNALSLVALAPGLKTPVLVHRGGLAPFCPKERMDAFVQAASKDLVEVIEFPGEAGEFRARGSRVLAIDTMLAFLKARLK